MIKTSIRILLSFLFCCLLLPGSLFSQSVTISADKNAKKIIFSNEKIKAVLDYNQKLNISSLIVNGQQVVSGDSGIYSMVATKDKIYSTLHLEKSPSTEVKGNTITVKKITYGDKENGIEENWVILITRDSIRFTINRLFTKDMLIEKAGLPVFTFNSIHTWDGAYQDYGGIAWFYLFNKKLETYGVHSKSSAFWNVATNNGMMISADATGNHVAMDYQRTATDKLAYTIDVAPTEFIPRFDSGTNRRRFIRDTTAPVWSSYKVQSGTMTQSITLSYFDFRKQYGRGKLVGVNQKEVSAVLNTIARMGVIDKQHFGGNSWHTPYGPICLHEQYIAQMGLAIDDPNYLAGYRDCLDFYRDHAIKPDGRVWPRWAYTNEDAMPGEFNNKGFYEAQWGYLMDSNPDYVTNVSELYDLNGDIDWVRTHQSSCERALDWIIRRDKNNNGLVEMMTDSTAQKRGSDWIDIIWASYENAFVNAKLYHALTLWAHIEEQLSNTQKANEYKSFAEKLKATFNKPIGQGGFWDEQNKCYIHWRDKDGSLHGRNTVIPVNFMAIAYHICDDNSRKKLILDAIETQMQNEKLFFWPLCLYTYAPGEGNDWQFPFPNYENGDLFLSWGALGVQAYASYKPEVGLQYVKNVLHQYAKDGLAFQRYGRLKQNGLGDDILSGNSLSVIGLYQAIYGINPLYNRFYLDPHITTEIAGTQLNYKYRNLQLTIDLDIDKYVVSDGRYKITSKKHFGFYSAKDTLYYFDGANENASLQLITGFKSNTSISIKNWNDTQCEWIQSSTTQFPFNKIKYLLSGLKRNINYSILINSKIFKKSRSDNNGNLEFEYSASKTSENITITLR